MSSLADSLVASSSRPIGLKCRSDLSARRQRYQGRSYWVVKEPVGLKYFRFQDEEYAVLRMLDGVVSLEDVKERFEADFKPHKITYQDLQQFIGMLHRSGLVVSEAPGQGVQLKKRRDKRGKQELMGRLSNVLAIRFKGIDPERILNYLYPYAKWFFAPATVFFCVALAISALLLLAIQFDVFRSRLPGFHEFFGPQNWFWLGVTLMVTKVLHEFGHGLLCKHYGGECHEMGIMFLVLTPCLYCNVSDSWMLPSKWQRAAIGAGGIYVELVLASIATFVWWYSDPGLMNHLALRVMFICSISTVLFNGNPLLRFDGYYIMSDLVEIPNLRQKATKILQRIMSQVCLGMEVPEDPFLPKGNHAFFAIYTIAAVVYRWFIFFSILFFLNKVFEPYGLKVIGQVIALMGLFGLVVMPMYKLFKFMKVPGRIYQVKKPRMLGTAGVAIAIIATVGLIPMPRSVNCSVQIRPREAAIVAAKVSGYLESVHVQPGDEVTEGQVIAQLKNVALHRGIETLKADLDIQAAKMEILRRGYGKRDQQSQHQINVATEILQSIRNQLAGKEVDRQRLAIRSPISGTLIPARRTQGQPSNELTLGSWSGTPLDQINRGVTLQQGDSICQIGDPNNMEALLAIDEADILDIFEGLEVRIKLDSLTGRTYGGKLTNLARSGLRFVDRSLSNEAGGTLATQTDKTGAARPLNPTYQAQVGLDNSDGMLRAGLRGHAKIRIRSLTLASRLWRYLNRTFHFVV